MTFELTAPTVADWEARLADLSATGMPAFVAEMNVRVVGYAYVSPWRTKPAYRGTVEDSVYVDAGHIRRGVGRALMYELVTRSTASGLREMIAVIADTGNPASRVLHEAFAFRMAGRLARVGCKQGQMIDTLLMQRSLA